LKHELKDAEGFRVAPLAAATATVLAALGLAACGGGSGSSNGDGGGPTIGGCDASISLADNDEGIAYGAGFHGLHYFVHGNDLCGFDPETGVAFEVDTGLDPDADGTSDVEAVLWDGTWQLGSGVSGAAVDRVIYTAGNEIRMVRTEGGSAAPPSPERISSEDQADSIDMMLLAPDYEDPDNALLAFRKLEGGEPVWYSTRVRNRIGAPQAFGENTVPVAPRTNPDTGAAEGWLVVETDPDDFSRQLHAVNRDLEKVGDPLRSGLTGSPDGVHLRASFSDGTLMLGIPEGDNESFAFYSSDENGGSLRHSGVYSGDDTPVHFRAYQYDHWDELRMVFFTTDGDRPVLYVVRPEGMVVDVDNAVPDGATAQAAFVIPTPEHVVWAFNGTESSGVSKVRSVEVDSGDPFSPFRDGETLIENDDPYRIFTTPVTASSDSGHVFFNEQNINIPGGDPDWKAHRFRAGNASSGVAYSEALWQGASHGGHMPHRGSEVFMVEMKLDLVEPVDQTLFAGRAGISSERVELGVLDQQSHLGSNVLITGVAPGPHRLMTAGSDLVYVDARHEDSARTVMQGENFGDLRPLPGF